MDISQKLTLACGATIKNRLAKSAMSEQLGDKRHDPRPELNRLYRRWALGGVGLSITGNVQVDRTALGEAHNVVLDEKTDLIKMKQWADAGRAQGTQLWIQLNHPGKQSPSFLSKTPVAPSAIPLEVGVKSAFNTPRALENEEIEAIIERFAFGAAKTKEAGFSGVQIHCAHGYLLSQFLSPLHNQRRDKWGGSLENRMRIVIYVYRAMRKAVGEKFPISIKLNSADFKKGGFTTEEALIVAQTLEQEGMDLIEISGGTYESPVMMGASSKHRLNEREAYFLEYAEAMREVLTVPLMVTGGFRSKGAMNRALSSGVTDMIGIARPFAVEPEFANKLLLNEQYVSTTKRRSTGSRRVDYLTMLDVTWYEHQIYRIARGKEPNPHLSAWRTVIFTLWRTGRHAFTRRRARPRKKG